jgi:RimJ/RimL family protein N-acetyltransferase
MRLISVYTLEREMVLQFLYEMLEERSPIANISHKKMPTWDEHVSFFDSKPYEAWYVIKDDGGFCVGNCYLTSGNEIGVHILPECQKHGYGRWTILEIMRQRGPRRYLANIAPLNIGSQKFFGKLGFKICQFTYELEHVEN